MSCLTPIKLKTGDVVPCSKCHECLKRKRREWLLRLEQEHSESCRSLFVTLTYDTEYLPYSESGLMCFDKKQVQLFFKRLRHKASFRYYLVSEYGGMYGRPHYHILLFNFIGDLQSIVDEWKYGFVHFGDVTSASINYCAAYVITSKLEKYDDERRRPFSLSSRNPGLGAGYIAKYKQYHKADYLNRNHGIRQFGERSSLPRYYREKIFTKNQRLLQNKASAAIGAEAFKVELESFKKRNPNSSISDYYEYRRQLDLECNRLVYSQLKQNRDGLKNF